LSLGSGEQIQAFLFRSASINTCIQELSEDGRLVTPETPPAPGEETSISDFSFAIQLEAKRMARAYELLFCFENSVRELIEDRLKEAFSLETWWVEGVPDSIRSKADKLKLKERQTPWHGPRGGTMLAFVDFPVLAQIITDRWEFFEDLLGKAEWVSHLFDEMNQSRRAIAHTGVLSQFDVERMELRVRDWLRIVG
jgi:Swt1-like HEPN